MFLQTTQKSVFLKYYADFQDLMVLAHLWCLIHLLGKTRCHMPLKNYTCTKKTSIFHRICFLNSIHIHSINDCCTDITKKSCLAFTWVDQSTGGVGPESLPLQITRLQRRKVTPIDNVTVIHMPGLPGNKNAIICTINLFFLKLRTTELFFSAWEQTKQSLLLSCMRSQMKINIVSILSY